MFVAKRHYATIVLAIFLHVVTPTIIRRQGGQPVGNRARNALAEDAVDLARAAKSASTSSDSGGDDSKNDKSSDTDKTSLGVSSTATSSSENKKKPGHPAGKGWRVWHRTCTPCPQDRDLRWRDPRIGWICGAYQRARRSFKSECSMFLRNCEDGTKGLKNITNQRQAAGSGHNYVEVYRTGIGPADDEMLSHDVVDELFTKLQDGKCPDDEPPGVNGTTLLPRHGRHFFYQYKVHLSGDRSSLYTDSASTSFGDTDTDDY